MTIAATSRLVLRPLDAGDLAAFVAYRSDPEVARYQSWEPTYVTEPTTTRSPPDACVSA